MSKQSAHANLAQGKAPQGDMIPWTMSQQFQDAEFPTLSGKPPPILLYPLREWSDSSW